MWPAPLLVDPIIRIEIAGTAFPSHTCPISRATATPVLNQSGRVKASKQAGLKHTQIKQLGPDWQALGWEKRETILVQVSLT